MEISRKLHAVLETLRLRTTGTVHRVYESVLPRHQLPPATRRQATPVSPGALIGAVAARRVVVVLDVGARLDAGNAERSGDDVTIAASCAEIAHLRTALESATSSAKRKGSCRRR